VLSSVVGFNGANANNRLDKLRLMMKNFKFIRSRTVRLVLTAIFIAVSLRSINQYTTKAVETHNTTKAYKPRPGRKRTQARKPGGYRGDSCSRQSPNPLTLMVPEDHVPLTTSERPTFFWYANTIYYPIRFTIYEPGQITPVYVQNITPTTPGIVALKLPETANKLKIGVQYRWTVSVICNRLRPSENIYAKAWIERVQSPIIPSNTSVCLSYYARAGIWYDALSCQAKSTEEFWSLLNQVQLLAIAKEQPQIKFVN
jgi:hypothetical protein